METMDDFKDELEASFRQIKEGDIITGTVIAVSEEEITLDLKYYAQGIIKVEDFSNDPDFAVLEQIHVGDEIRIIGETHRYRVGVLTVSDRSARGEREDLAGPLIRELVEKDSYLVVDQSIVPDDQKTIEEALIRLADQVKVDLILTTGGTGFSVRDVTPEATMAVAGRNAPGIAEAIRAYSGTITPRAMLSRAASVIRGRTLIVNLPGSPKAVRESLDFVLPNLYHGLDVLKGEVTDCGSKVHHLHR